MPEYPAGKYCVELLGQQGFSEAKTGTTQFYMKFTVTHAWDFHRGEWVEVEQAERTFYRYITANSINYAIEDFRQLGYQGDKLAPLDMRHPQKHVFTGQIEMACTVETYEGKRREKWGLIRGTTFVEKEIDDNAMKKLDTLFGSAMKKATPAGTPAPKPNTSNALPIVRSQPRGAAPQAASAAAVAEPPANNLTVSDDDIPF